MPAIHKGSPKIQFEFVASQRQSVLGGLPAIEALAQEFDLWNKLRCFSLIHSRKRKGSGFGPDAIVAQFLYCFAEGGASLVPMFSLIIVVKAAELRNFEKRRCNLVAPVAF